MAKVKISDVAREAGVSLGTVSNALNHPEKLRPETLKLINETINRLGYLPNQSARQLAGGATKSFGLVLPRLDHGFSLQIASGAHNEARKHGYDLLIANADNDDILEDHYLRYFMGTQMSGVMVQPMASPDWHPATRTCPGTEMPLLTSAETTPEANTSVRPTTKSGRSSAGRSAIWAPMP